MQHLVNVGVFFQLWSFVQHFALTISSTYEPQYYYQAIPHLHWRLAMNEELQAIEQNNT